ncbi:hypothetical protein HY968_04110 [Candidatus Kaiserbacteria bacterium]|nr:hypothetical protein [Candidatus Kaiserbacteria bacterium]
MSFRTYTFALVAIFFCTIISVGLIGSMTAHADGLGDDVIDFGGFGDSIDYGGFGDLTDYGGFGDVTDYGGFGDVADYGTFGDVTDYGDFGSCDYGCGDNSGYSDACGGGCDYNGDGYTTTDEITDYYSSSQPSYGCGSGCGGGSYGGGSSYGGGGGFSFPSTPRYTFAPPSYSQPIVYQQQQQQQQQQQHTTSNTTTNNTCTGGSCNTNYTDNSINGSFNTATVYPVHQNQNYHPVQYIYDQPTYYQQRPYCTITLSNYNNYGNYNNGYNYGYNSGPATLTWTSTNATSGYISPNVGSVSAYGSMTVYPVSGQIYTMTVYGQGGTATCVTNNYYTPPTYVPPTYVQPHTPYVSLSQIPYTGFDFGTFGNALYWMALITFAGAAAYLLFYFNGGALALAGASFRSKKTKVAYVAPKIAMPALRSFSEVGPKAVILAPQASVPVAPTPILSPIQPAQVELPTPANFNATTDSMNIHQSKAGEAPRITIVRS